MDLQLAKGVRDIPPEEKLLKNQVVNTLTEVFELYGFAPLETPMLERIETLTAKFAAGEASDALKETFKLKDQGDRSLALRFDLTVPLARFVAMNPTLKMPFKRYEVGRVFRDGPIKLGRYREFWQCDIDIVGSNSMLADAEILAVVDATFKKLGLDIIIKVNNRKLLNGILEEAGIENKEAAIIAIDKLDKIGKDGVSKELEERGFTGKQIISIFNLILEGIRLAELESKINNEEGKQGIQELEELFSYLQEMGVKNVQFEVSLARGLAYYTGTVFEASLKNGKITSSLAGGGRYDNMISNFMGSSQIIPATGISFGLEPIADMLKLEGKVKSKNAAKVYVIPINTINESLKVVQQLRSNGIPASISLGKKGVSKNLEYASTLGIPYVIIIGDKELAEKKVVLRNMASGEEQLLTLMEVIMKLK